ncbi:MAG: hypothetical protein H6710_00015 [Myxococcales bacterium]|nr:hypothetical protein [Myxococcales bacterium]
MSGAIVVEVLADALLVGGTAVGLTLVVRRVPPVAGWVRRGLKPWACDLCCATWSALMLTIALAVLLSDPWTMGAWMPAVAIATIGLHRADPPPPPELDLPALEDEPP